MKHFIQTLIVPLLLISTLAWAQTDDALDLAKIELLVEDEMVAMNEEFEELGEEIQEMVAEIKKTVREAMEDGAFIGILLETDRKQNDGVHIIGVTPGGPAQAVGIKTGDVVVEINGESTKKSVDGSPAKNLQRSLKKVAPGETVRLKLKRDGEEISLALVAASRKDHLKSGFEFLGDEIKMSLHEEEHEAMEHGYLSGIRLYALNDDLGAYFGSGNGMLVLDVPEETDIPLKGGDVILRIGDRIPNSPSHTWRIIHSYDPGETMNLTILRTGEEQTLSLTKP